MTRLADHDYFLGMESKGRVAKFSPDGRFFVIVIRKGNIQQNTNEFSLLLYRVSEALKSPKPDILVKMSSSSNSDAIANVRWLADSKSMLFLGENPGRPSQVYEVNVRSRKLTARTSSPTAVKDYDCTPDGQTIIGAAESSYRQLPGPSDADISRHGVAITEQPLQALLSGEYGRSNPGQQLFVQRRGQKFVSFSLPTDNFVFGQQRLSVAPDGRHALIISRLLARSLQPEWLKYDAIRSNEYFRLFFGYPIGQAFTQLGRIFFVDTADLAASPLWSAPTIGTPNISWAGNSSSVFLQSVLLPLTDTSPGEEVLREQRVFDVEVDVADRQYRLVDRKAFLKPEPRYPLQVTLKEDCNHPPRIFVSDPDARQDVLLLDLNPQFSELDLGKVDTLEWVTDGVRLTGGLYLPPDYEAGRKYALVIQTHGFNPDRFSMDGLQEWSSAYAARPLAAKGFLVLQLQGFKDPEADDHYNDKKTFGVNAAEAGRKINVRGIETAIDYLESEGLIDQDRVGVAGFSISVSFVAYLLTHSNKHFAAASLVDGIDAGYFQELAYPEAAWGKDQMNGDTAPFGEGLNTWLRESPSFSMGNVTTPLRLLALGRSDPLVFWEWFAGLSLQKKPVDYILLPDAAHLVVKPWERLTAQQGLVDWFLFWLKGEEDPEPRKCEQYSRWRALRSRIPRFSEQAGPRS